MDMRARFNLSVKEMLSSVDEARPRSEKESVGPSRGPPQSTKLPQVLMKTWARLMTAMMVSRARPSKHRLTYIQEKHGLSLGRETELDRFGERLRTGPQLSNYRSTSSPRLSRSNKYAEETPTQVQYLPSLHPLCPSAKSVVIFISPSRHHFLLIYKSE